MKIFIITPVRNEEKFIHFTLKSMMEQSIPPDKWIIVNDGSTDKTEETIKEFMKRVPYIEYISLPDRGYREPGRGVIEAFYEGFKKIENENYDILAKFDGDLKFPYDTLEEICKEFRDDPKLGITGGSRYEQVNNKGAFRKILVPKGFVGGPNKFYRKKCFEDINGLIRRAGWDGVDTLKANMKGWRTGEIDSLRFVHLKSTGTAKNEGLIKACEKYGDVSYYMGGYVWYFILRVIGRSIKARNPKVGYYMVRGYIRSERDNKVRESREFRKFYKKVQKQNMRYWFKLGFNVLKKNGI